MRSMSTVTFKLLLPAALVFTAFSAQAERGIFSFHASPDELYVGQAATITVQAGRTL